MFHIELKYNITYMRMDFIYFELMFFAWSFCHSLLARQPPAHKLCLALDYSPNPGEPLYLQWTITSNIQWHNWQSRESYVCNQDAGYK